MLLGQRCTLSKQTKSYDKISSYMLLLRHKPTLLPLHQHFRLHWLLITNQLVRMLSDLETTAQKLWLLLTLHCVFWRQTQEVYLAGVARRSGKSWKPTFQRHVINTPREGLLSPTENCSEWRCLQWQRVGKRDWPTFSSLVLVRTLFTSQTATLQ